jgi:hypothetical protein
MNDGDIDDVLKEAGKSASVDPALLKAIANTIGADLQAVRPLPASWVLVVALMAGSAAVALAGGAVLGLHGIEALGALRIALIFPLLLILIWLCAAGSVAEMIPGNWRVARPATLLTCACLVLTAVFGVVFTDYGTAGFVSQGVVCLRAGLLHAIPTGAISWWVVRRGLALRPVAAGLAIGGLSGLAGLTMLELHCANFEAPHVMVWHTAVLALGGVAGGLLASALSRRNRLR